MTLQEQIRANRLRTALLVVAFLVLFAALGLVLAAAYDPGALGVVGAVAVVYGIVSWLGAGRMVALMTGARKVEKADAPELYRAVENAAIAAGLERTPDVYLVEDAAPNAFAAGRDPKRAYVAATTGLLELMERRELEGVMAHEVAHIRNRDVRLMSLAAVLFGVIALVSDMLLRMAFYGGGRRRGGGNPALLAVAFVALILAPVAAMGLQLALSRRREFLADASAAEITGDAEGMALALRKLQRDTQVIRRVERATAHLYIESPLNKASGARAALRGLFDTHPPLEDRIAALEQAGGFRLAEV